MITGRRTRGGWIILRDDIHGDCLAAGGLVDEATWYSTETIRAAGLDPDGDPDEDLGPYTAAEYLYKTCAADRVLRRGQVVR